MAKTHLGEVITHKNGWKMKVTRYDAYNDMDVTVYFPSGTYTRKIKYDQFRPTLKYPSRYDYVGKTNKNALTGQMMEITDYRSYHDITVRFANGAVNSHTGVDAFLEGHVTDPSADRSALLSKKYKGVPKTSRRKKEAEKHIGESVLCKNGHTAVITEWRTRKDIDVRFDDGKVSEHTSYNAFLQKTLLHPDGRARTSANTPKTERVGEKSFNKASGLWMTITAYRGADDLDIMFEDGTCVCHRDYNNFRKGRIRYPHEKNRLGETVYNPQTGLSMKVSAYRRAGDLDVLFEDGTLVPHQNYKYFGKGLCTHPVLSHPCRKTYHGWKILKKAFATNTDIYYYCRPENSPLSSCDIRSVREMYKNPETPDGTCVP